MFAGLLGRVMAASNFNYEKTRPRVFSVIDVEVKLWIDRDTHKYFVVLNVTNEHNSSLQLMHHFVEKN